MLYLNLPHKCALHFPQVQLFKVLHGLITRISIERKKERKEDH